MRKISIALVLAATFSMHPVFANDNDMSDSKPCKAIAQACSKAGFDYGTTEGKKFWKDCMKPIILGKTVKDVTIDAATVKACRMTKIDKMKKELKELEKVSS